MNSCGTATTGAKFQSGHHDASTSALAYSSICFRHPPVVPTSLLLPHKAADADCVASTAEQEIGAELAGNRGAWWQANALMNYDAVAPDYYKKFGLDVVNNAADRTLLTSTLSSPTAIARGFGTPPYPGFPVTQTVAQALRPYPQYSAANVLFAPLGNNWYDALHAKVTKRMSNGFTVLAAYTFSKAQGNYESAFNNIWNRPPQKSLVSFDQPQSLAISALYQVPKFGLTKSNSWLQAAFAEWQIGTVLRYASGLPIMSPLAQNAISSLIFQSNIPMNRVAGVPLFLNDPNSADPKSTFVLNPAAWSNPAPGTMGTASKYYGDYRNRRRPDESFNISKSFKIRERATFQVRFELYNAFNRTRLNAPTSTNSLATQVVSSNGVATSGFGWVDPTGANGVGNPRTGQLVARITF